jgi:hypothetical protein
MLGEFYSEYLLFAVLASCNAPLHGIMGALRQAEQKIYRILRGESVGYLTVHLQPPRRQEGTHQLHLQGYHRLPLHRLQTPPRNHPHHPRSVHHRDHHSPKEDQHLFPQNLTHSSQIKKEGLLPRTRKGELRHTQTTQ